MPSTSKNYLASLGVKPKPRIYTMTSTKQGAELEEVPGYDLMKAKLWLLDARLVTMTSDHLVWYIWDDREQDFITDNKDSVHFSAQKRLVSGRPMPFVHINEALDYVFSLRGATWEDL